MEALKLKGWVDTEGHLHIRDAIALPVGEVELVVWQIPQSPPDSIPAQKRAKTSVKALQDLFEDIEPVAPDFDPDEARWEALKEKYDL
jgi:hypothetical protein